MFDKAKFDQIVFDKASDKNYSRGDEATLPPDDSDLETGYTESDYGDVEVKDADYIVQYASGEYAIHLFKDKNVRNTDKIKVHWEGKTSVAPSTNIVYLQIYNYNSGSWETLASDSSTGAGTVFSLDGSILENTPNYYDNNNWIACRIYQDFPA